MGKCVGCVIAYRKNHNNYGTSLQAYAMLKKIKQLGYEVEVLNYVKQLNFFQKFKYLLNAFLCGELKYVFRDTSIDENKRKYPEYAKGLEIRTLAVNSYKKKKIETFFCDYVGYKNLSEGAKKYDVIIVGSDQVWSPLSLPNKYFNLLFVPDTVKKVAYASSFGVSDIPFFQKYATGAFLNRFSVIGVREQNGKDIVETLSNMKATVVADPTLLLSREEWNQEIQSSKVCVSEPYIFCYLISDNEESRRVVKAFAENKGLKIVCIRHMEQYREVDEFYGDIVPYDVDPNDFVKYISGAEYVCTDSFHCTVFSIIFHRKFMTFYRSISKSKKSKNSRIDSLFNVLGVDRSHIFDGDIRKIDNFVDWKLVETNLFKLRTDSINFLNSALGENK